MIEPKHIGDGLYFTDSGYYIEISVNHHNNVVAALDISDLNTAIDYLQRVKERLERSKIEES